MSKVDWDKKSIEVESVYVNISLRDIKNLIRLMPDETQVELICELLPYSDRINDPVKEFLKEE